MDLLAKADLFDIAMAAQRLRAGLPIGLASDPRLSLLALDTGPPAMVQAWIESQQCDLFLSAQRWQSLQASGENQGVDDLPLGVLPQGVLPQGVILPLPANSTPEVLLQLAQANPRHFGPLASWVSTQAKPFGGDILDYLKLAQVLPAALVRYDNAAAAPSAETGTRAGTNTGTGTIADQAPPLCRKQFHASLANSLHQVGDTPVPLEGVGETRMHLFRDCLGNESHLAVEVGSPAKAQKLASAPTLVRIHSSCLTGDIFHSQRCDCGHQLAAALRAMASQGYGVLVYLAQEGRGIGLNNKLKSYLLQQSGLDTVDGNLALGFQDDERDFVYAQKILSILGIKKVRLLTNNPKKIETLAKNDISDVTDIEVVERVPLVEVHSRLAGKYLSDKAKRSGHIIESGTGDLL